MSKKSYQITSILYGCAYMTIPFSSCLLMLFKSDNDLAKLVSALIAFTLIPLYSKFKKKVKNHQTHFITVFVLYIIGSVIFTIVTVGENSSKEFPLLTMIIGCGFVLLFDFIATFVRVSNEETIVPIDNKSNKSQIVTAIFFGMLYAIGLVGSVYLFSYIDKSLELQRVGLYASATLMLVPLPLYLYIRKKIKYRFVLLFYAEIIVFLLLNLFFLSPYVLKHFNENMELGYNDVVNLAIIFALLVVIIVDIMHMTTNKMIQKTT